MSTLYYVTAVAPASFYVGGRQRQLYPGDSQGPFTEAELSQIMASPDRRKLVTTTFVGNAPKVNPASLKQNSFPTAPTPTAAPKVEEQPFPTQETIFEELVQEPVVNPINDVPEPLTIPQAQELEQVVVSGEVLPEPEKEVMYTSYTQPLPEVSDFMEPEPSPFEVAPQEETTESTEGGETTAEGDDAELSPRARRRRRQL